MYATLQEGTVRPSKGAPHPGLDPGQGKPPSPQLSADLHNPSYVVSQLLHRESKSSPSPPKAHQRLANRVLRTKRWLQYSTYAKPGTPGIQSGDAQAKHCTQCLVPAGTSGTFMSKREGSMSGSVRHIPYSNRRHHAHAQPTHEAAATFRLAAYLQSIGPNIIKRQDRKARGSGDQGLATQQAVVRGRLLSTHTPSMISPCSRSQLRPRSALQRCQCSVSCCISCRHRPRPRRTSPACFCRTLALTAGAPL